MTDVFQAGVNASVAYATYLIKVGLISLGALGVTGILRNRMNQGFGFGGGPFNRRDGGGPYGGYGGPFSGDFGGPYKRKDDYKYAWKGGGDNGKMSEKEREYLDQYYRDYYKNYYENYFKNELKRKGRPAATNRSYSKTNKRKKRSAERLPKSVVVNILPIYTDPEEEQVLKDILDDKQETCGLRLVCELAAIKDRMLSRQEWEILHLIRGLKDRKEYQGHDVDTLIRIEREQEYLSSAEYGRLGGNCGSLFDTCSYNSVQILYIVNKMRSIE